MNASDFLTTEQAAKELGVSRVTTWRYARSYPGFAFRLGGYYRIPRAHIVRVKMGETAAAIAKSVRSAHGVGSVA